MSPRGRGLSRTIADPVRHLGDGLADSPRRGVHHPVRVGPRGDGLWAVRHINGVAVTTQL